MVYLSNYISFGAPKVGVSELDKKASSEPSKEKSVSTQAKSALIGLAVILGLAGAGFLAYRLGFSKTPTVQSGSKPIVISPLQPPSQNASSSVSSMFLQQKNQSLPIGEFKFPLIAKDPYTKGVVILENQEFDFSPLSATLQRISSALLEFRQFAYNKTKLSSTDLAKYSGVTILAAFSLNTAIRFFGKK